jgi:hypothetical protein
MNHDLGEWTGEWWVQDSRLHYRTTGTESAIGTALLWLTSLGGGGTLGSVEQMNMTFVEPSTVRLTSADESGADPTEVLVLTRLP